MVTTKKREHFQWQEALVSPKRRQDWKSSNKRGEQRPYGIHKKKLDSRMLVEEPVSTQRPGRYMRPSSDNSIVQPHRERIFWSLAAQKPKPDLRLRNTPTKAAHKLYTSSVPLLSDRERVLLDERYALLERRYSESLTDVQAARLRWLEVKLDEIDDQDPVEQEADRRLAQTSTKLDEILSLLRSLPRKSAVQEDAV